MIYDVFSILLSRWDFFYALAVEHLCISLLSCVLAGVIGLAIGVAISEYQKSSGFVLGLVNFIYTIPSISLLGFLIPLSGIGNVTAVIALTVYALLPMVRNTHTGLVNVEPALVEAARGMGSTDWQILSKIKLPLAVPMILSGLRNMVVMTVALTGIASFIGAGGLGVAIYRGITTNNTAMTVAGSLLIALMALILDALIGFMERLVSRKHGKRAHPRAAMVIGGVIVVALALLCVSPAGDKQVIRVASKPMTEQYILSEMLKELIEQDTNLKVSLTQGVGGGTANIQPAMVKGEFDLYPEYTGTGWNIVLKHDGLYDESMFPELAKEYAEQYGFEWLGMYGFNNTYGLAVRREIAEKYNLKTYSDLQPYAKDLIFGAEYDFFEREDGYDALCKAYGLAFKNTRDMDIGLKYEAINQGKIDIMNIFTTDGQLTSSNVVVLKDDLGFYPSYMCGNVVRKEALDKYPQLKSVLTRLDGILTDEKMAAMNHAVESEGRNPKDVAHEFLRAQGLLRGGD